MKKRGISQEMLKLIACATMLIDHVGATVVYSMYLDACMVNGVDMLGQAIPQRARALFRVYQLMRVIGRVAFPIFCFLLAEGVHYTRDPKRYALRLTVGAVLSELPFDLALFGGWTLGDQSVMITLLLGFFALRAMEKCGNYVLKCLAVLPFAVLAQLLATDYGGAGLLLIGLFGISREFPRRWLIRLLGMALICNYLIPGSRILIGGVQIPIELFALLALIPIALYSGRKAITSRAVQWGFYLFYPAHLMALYLIGRRL